MRTIEFAFGGCLRPKQIILIVPAGQPSRPCPASQPFAMAPRYRRNMGGLFMSDPSNTASPLDRLEAKLGSSWTAVRKAREDARLRHGKLEQLFRTRSSP